MARAYHNKHRVTVDMKRWNGKLELSKVPAMVVWGPHRTNHYKVVCLKEHDTPTGWRILKGSIIQFAAPEYRDRFLAAHHPKRWGKLLKKWT